MSTEQIEIAALDTFRHKTRRSCGSQVANLCFTLNSKLLRYPDICTYSGLVLAVDNKVILPTRSLFTVKNIQA